MDKGTNVNFSNLDSAIKKALSNGFAYSPNDTYITGAFFVSQTTQFPNTTHRYYNRYIILRIENSFGACCIESKQASSEEIEQLSGKKVAELLRSENLAFKVAALDAFLGHCYPLNDTVNGAHRRILPAGNPLKRAQVRDAAISELAQCQPGEKVALIGVVNPLVDAIESQGAICLPCDYNMEKTLSGIVVSKAMDDVLSKADRVIATGMTLSNSSFDKLICQCREYDIPLIIYAQTGANIARQFLGTGLIALMAETFPFSQFSAEPTPIYLLQQPNKE